MVRCTSAAVYRELVHSGALSHARAKVYGWLYLNGPATANEIAVGIGERRHGSTSGRLTELRDLGVVHELGTRACRVSGKEIILWDATGTGITGQVQRRESGTRQACRAVLEALDATTPGLEKIAIARIRELVEEAL